jgi:hypothetical protein
MINVDSKKQTPLIFLNLDMKATATARDAPSHMEAVE